jgi:hypothetical protein
MRTRTFQIAVFLLLTLPVCGAAVCYGDESAPTTPGVQDSGTLSVSLSPQMLTVIPMLTLLLQVVKGIEPLKKLIPWLPIIAIGLAIGAAIIMKLGGDVQGQILAGVTMGLATTGVYEAAKVSNKSSVVATASPASGGTTT